MNTETDTSSQSRDGFDLYFGTLIDWMARHGTLPVPLDLAVPSPTGLLQLGVWVETARDAYRLGVLKIELIPIFETVPGWKWGRKLERRAFDHDAAHQEWVAGMSYSALARKYGVALYPMQQAVKGVERETTRYR